MDIDMDNLTEEERDVILSVLNRDEKLRANEQNRIRKLQAEVKQIRLKGVIKADSDPSKTCARCRQEFGWFFNRGQLCPSCHNKVCEQCRYNAETKEGWLCILCFKQAELEAMSGQWFYSKFRKSKRNKKTNQVISGPEMVKASIRRCHSTVGEVHSGHISDDIKHALSNNNASPKSARSSIVSGEEESSDTQSMEAVSPVQRRGRLENVSFPRDSDRRKLHDLMKKDSTASSALTKRHAFYASDSSSDSSEPNSPNLSERVANHPCNMTQSDAVSIQSSEGHMTVVTEMNISDIDTISQTSNASQNASTSLDANLPYSIVANTAQNKVDPLEDPVHVESNTKSAEFDVTDSKPVSTDITFPPAVPVDLDVASYPEQHKLSSSDSDDDYTTEQITKIKFRRVSMQKKPTKARTPSPPIEHKPRSQTGSSNESKSTDHTTTASTVTVVSAAGAAGAADLAVSVEENQKPDDQCGVSAASMPVIAVTQSDQTSLQDNSELDSLGELYEDENIDELFASHSSTLSRQKGLLSPFGDSRESIASYYSDAGEGNYGKIPISGEVLFGLDYNYKSGSLEVAIKQCRDLAPVDTKRKRSDPYVKTYLLPDRTKSGKRKTRVKKHTLNPVFDEVLKYMITKSELETRTLWLTVWHNDTFGRNDFLGEVTIPLDYYSFDNNTPQWYKLQERPPLTEGEDGTSPMTMLTYKGDLILSLKYVSAENVGKRKGHKSRGDLHVLVKEARNLTAMRANGTSDPFCKGYLLPDKGRHSKQKTPVVKRDCNPQWNHTFVFEDISLDELWERSLELTVWDHDRFTSNDFLGGVRLNRGTGKVGDKEVEWMDAHGEEVSAWQSVLDRPNTWIDAGLLLRPNMSKRT